MGKAQKTWIRYSMIIGLSTLIGILAYSFSATAEIKPEDLEGYEVDFDSPGHEKEIEIVYQYRISNSKLDREVLKRDYIGVDLYDIDNDGRKEIIYRISGTPEAGYCGNRGCAFNILKQSNKRDHKGNLVYAHIRWDPNKNNLGGVALDKVKVLKTMTLGTHDLLLNNRVIWRWQGDYYDYYKSLYDRYENLDELED